MSEANSNEIIIAVIGLLGIIATAVFSNWDKMFPKKNQIKTTFSGYRTTGNFETELRYYFEVSGVRKTIESQAQQMLHNYRESLMDTYPEDSHMIHEMVKAIEEESITVDETIRKLLPAYRAHMTVEEIQELNKFYSTEIMQNMTRKMIALTQDAAPLQIELIQGYQQRIDLRIAEIERRHSTLSE
ncbi:DUF2059 domain-containing protein [Marinicella sp. W31]|uniref:DUF2059 domain-containing protein n=1 Tax=Marinicella sp. W31 TaxID=3023713 RepID=UPI0037575262